MINAFNKYQATELCLLSKCKQRCYECDGFYQTCFMWNHIDPFKRKLLEIKYRDKRINEIKETTPNVSI